MTTLEQLARDLLERMGIENAQSFTAGDVVELANLIAERNAAGRMAGELLTAAKLALGEAQAYADEVDGVERHQAAVAALAPIRDAIAKAEAGLLEASPPWEPLTPERLEELREVPQGQRHAYWLAGKAVGSTPDIGTLTSLGGFFDVGGEDVPVDSVTHIMAIATPEMPK